MAKRTKKTKKTEPEEEFEEIPACEAPGCAEPAMPDSDFCLIHLGLDMAVDKLQSSFRKGDTTGAIVGGLGMLLFHNAPSIMQQVKQRVPPPPAPARPPKIDPFDALGLNAQTATQADVRAMQRALSKLYHPDKNAAAVNPEMIARINAAATECLKQLRAAKRP